MPAAYGPAGTMKKTWNFRAQQAEHGAVGGHALIGRMEQTGGQHFTAEFRQGSQPMESGHGETQLAELHGSVRQVQMRQNAVATLDHQAVGRLVKRIFRLKLKFVARRALKDRQ